MTIRMPEAEAAQDFSKVLAYVSAGDDVVLERDGEAVAHIFRPSSVRPQPAHINQIDRRLRSFRAAEGAREAGPALEKDLAASRDSLNWPSRGDDPAAQKGWNAAEAIRRLKAWEEENGVVAVMTPDFAADVREGHERMNQPLDGSKWDF